ncbi:MAG: BatD family protein [Muribaculaceae bacterium]|nr:BatD family protein [Muribaculaceae bacterium]
MKFSATHIILSAMAAAACLTATAAPQVKVTAALDSAVVVMGDLNRLHVTVDIPEAYASSAQLVDFPVLTPGAEYIEYKGVDVVASDSSSVFSDGHRKLDFDFTIQAFDPGTLTLPPFAVVATPGADTAFSNVVTLKVLPVDVDSLETINPMASVASPQSRWYDFIPTWLLWVLLGIAAAGVAVWCYFAFRKHQATAELRRTPPVPPYELAISRLANLRSRNLPESGHEKEYYTELVDILRQYLQGRFGINAMEMTSTQIVKALRSNPDTKMTAEVMRSVLSIADFVKFAKVRPLPDDNIKAFTRAQDFVEQTKPAPEPEPESTDTAGAKNPINQNKTSK